MATNLYAPGKSKLIEPGHGNYQDEWDAPCNSNFGATDALVAGTTTINMALAEGSPPTVSLVFKTFETDPEPWTATNAGQNLRLLVTGALGADSYISIPKGISGFWFVDNQTSGSFSLIVATTALNSSSVSVKQGFMSILFCDGTNVKFADNGTLPPVATDTVHGIVTQGLLKTNCVQLDNDAKIPYQTDKYIISTTDPVAAQGSQDWLWFKVG